ncbi:MAG: hypothetical protein EPO22_09370 [Dehalococcoidia bacterium]|nr:MAG: hypothetical protein EPO22_09370 [Dehalococcoidia bacterium]
MMKVLVLGGVAVVLIAVAAAGAAIVLRRDGGSTTGSTSRELSLQHPFILASPPSYLKSPPDITPDAGSVLVSYSGVDEGSPRLTLQEFESPPNFEQLPQRPALQDRGGGVYYAVWRCQRLAINTIVAWDKVPDAATRDGVLRELEAQMEGDCLR